MSHNVVAGTHSSNQPNITETFIKKILAHLDDPDQSKLNIFLPLFNSTGSKIIVNATPIAQPMLFLQMWSSQVVQTQHSLTSVDYHVIPGSSSLICNVTCKVRFDESGRDKAGNNSVVNKNNNTANIKVRPIWGSYFGVSLQLILDERIFRGDFNGVISAFNYNMIYKPEDTLMNI